MSDLIILICRYCNARAAQPRGIAHWKCDYCKGVNAGESDR